MTAGMDRPHQLRMALGNPAEDKECGSGVMRIQEVKEAVGIALNPALIAIPIGTLDNRFKTGDVIVILDVNRQGIDYGVTCGERSMHGYIRGDSRMTSKTAPR